jgi:uncharacterized membrane protein YfcA
VTLLQDLVALVSGLFVGFSLGLIGGGGSILAVPLLLYAVGVPDPHRAIGTSALAVAVNAFLNLIPHARSGYVRWREVVVFAACGVVGAWAGSTLGKTFNGADLLVLFALLMIVIAGLMLRPRRAMAAGTVAFSPRVAARLAETGFAVGMLAGFFGIGGGFLIVPGLVLAAGMTIIEAIGSSLFAVGSFGLTTAANYAASGLIDWTLAALFIVGGTGGGWLGASLAKRLARGRNALNRVFAGVIVLVALYMLARNFHLLG